MRHVGTLLLLGLLALALPRAVASTVFFVDPANGADGNDGQSLEGAFKTVQRCVNTLHGAPAGSQCRLRAGIYKYDSYILVEHLAGQAGNPYVVGKYAGDEGEVMFEGTVDVHAHCDPGGDVWREVAPDFASGGASARHWAATLPVGVEPWQLFVGKWGEEGEPFVNARWPDGGYNGRHDDKSIFLAKTWKHGNERSQYVDMSEDGARVPGLESILVDDGEAPALSSSGINATGASAILNIGHWKSFATTVVSHSPGSDNFTYFDMKHWGTPKYKPAHDLYYLENKLQFLDQETEWFYDTGARRLHLKTRNDEHPCGLRVQARVQAYAFRIIDTLHLTLEDMTFWATTVWAASIGAADDVNGKRLYACATQCCLSGLHEIAATHRAPGNALTRTDPPGI